MDTTSNDDPRSSHTSTSDQNKTQEKSDFFIPGFYYDSQKKSYFRILPDHNNSNPYTRKMLGQKQAEESRQKYLKGVLPSSEWRSRHGSPITSPTDLVERRKSGFTSNLEYKRKFIEHYARSLSITPELSLPINKCNTDSSTAIFMQVDSSFSKLLLVLEDDHRSNLFLPFVRKMMMYCVDLNPKEDPVHDSNSFLKKLVKFKKQRVLKEEKVISKIHWVNGYSNILASVHDPGGATVSLLSHRERDDKYKPCFLYRHHNETWTCEWCQYPGRSKKISLGCNDNIQVIDVETCKMSSRLATESSVMSQKFSSQTGSLFNGMRNGNIFVSDLRCQRTGSLKLKQDHTVVSMQLLYDQNYLLASSWNNQIWQWDVRATKVVREFKEHNNTNKKIPLHMDSTESIVYSAGQDGFVRLWSIKSGELLKTIPPPHSGEQRPPLLAYSQEWSSGRGPSGLLAMSPHQMHWYSDI